MEKPPENRLNNPEFAEQARERVAFYIEELLTDSKERIIPSAYLWGLPDLIRKGQKISAPTFLSEGLVKCKEEFRLTNVEVSALKKMIEKQPDYSIYPKLPERNDKGSRLDDPKVLDDILDYLTKRVNERIDTCESEESYRKYQIYKNLAEQLKQGKDLSSITLQLEGFVISCLQDIVLTPDEINQVKAILEGNK